MNTTAQIIRSEKIQAEKEAEETPILYKCDACREDFDELFTLEIAFYVHLKTDKVCSECLHYLHSEFKTL